MLEEGAFADPKPDAVFGLHGTSRQPLGTIGGRERGAMASSDKLEIRVKGSQTHAAYPWQGVDPIAVASRIVLALHAIPARQVDTRIGSVISIGAIHGGVRHNIIPEEVELLGTIRALDPAIREQLHAKIEQTVAGIAASAGATAEVDIRLGYGITFNDPELTAWTRPVLAAAPGVEHVVTPPAATGAEDFSFYQERAPGVFFWVGVRPPDVSAADAAPNHSPRFFVDERALPGGLGALARVAVSYLEGGPR